MIDSKQILAFADREMVQRSPYGALPSTILDYQILVEGVCLAVNEYVRAVVTQMQVLTCAPMSTEGEALYADAMRHLSDLVNGIAPAAPAAK